MESSLRLQFGFAVNVFTPIENWELKWVLEKDEKRYLFDIFVADSEQELRRLNKAKTG